MLVRLLPKVRLIPPILILGFGWLTMWLPSYATPVLLAEKPFVMVQKVLGAEPQPRAEFGIAVVFSPDERYMLVAAPTEDVGENVDQGVVHVFQRQGIAWKEIQKLTASDGDSDDRFGSAIAVAGAPVYTIIVGAPGDDTDDKIDLGAAYIFSYDGLNWSQQTKLNANEPNAFSFNRRGSAVAIDVAGDNVFIGAPGVHDTLGHRTGAVYFFTHSSTDAAWIQRQRLTGSAGSISALGQSITLSNDGTVLLVGARRSPSGTMIIGSGIVHLYRESANTWTLNATLQPSGGADLDGFGAALAISENNETILIGAPDAGGSKGKAYFFIDQGSGWIEKETIMAPPGSEQARFGQAIALDAAGTSAAIGAWLDGGGAIHVVKRTGEIWSFTQSIRTTDAPNPHLGRALDMSRDGALIAGGARNASASSEKIDNSGAVYIFVRGDQVFLPLLSH